MRMLVPPSTAPGLLNMTGVVELGRDGTWTVVEVPEEKVGPALQAGAVKAAAAGVVEITLRVDVDDAEALIAAGKRSTARDGPTDWEPGQPSPAADDPGNIIDGPAQAVVDLLMEGLVRCFQPLSHDPDPLVDKVDGIADISWAEKRWTPAGASFLDAIIAALRAEHPTAVKACFGVEEWDNGYFFTGHPAVELADGSSAHFEGEEPGTSLDGGLTGELTATYGPVGERGQLILTLATGDVDVEAEGGLF
jgi:hypothetical protein